MISAYDKNTMNSQSDIDPDGKFFEQKRKRNDGSNELNKRNKINHGRRHIINETKVKQSNNDNDLQLTAVCIPESSCFADDAQFCYVRLQDISGIIVSSSDDDGFTTITAPDGIKFNQERLENSLELFNEQFPEGSLTNYLMGIANNINTSVVTNARGVIITMLTGIILQTLVFYLIIISLMSIYGVIGIATAIVFIIVGIMITVIVFVIVSIEVAKYGTNIVTEIEAEITPIVDRVQCALTSAVCCYSIGAACCCENGTNPTCLNSPIITPTVIDNNQINIL